MAAANGDSRFGGLGHNLIIGLGRAFGLSSGDLGQLSAILSQPNLDIDKVVQEQQHAHVKKFCETHNLPMPTSADDPATQVQKAKNVLAYLDTINADAPTRALFAMWFVEIKMAIKQGQK
jgi:hypothetical protein